jgi:hypothetical protein
MRALAVSAKGTLLRVVYEGRVAGEAVIPEQYRIRETIAAWRPSLRAQQAVPSMNRPGHLTAFSRDRDTTYEH